MATIRSLLDWLAVGLLVIGVVALYGPLLPELAGVWEQDPNYSHGYLVPVISGWFAWRAWRENGTPLVVDSVTRSAVYEGMSRCTIGLLLHLTMWLLHNLFLDVVALILLLRGLLLVLGGRQAYATYSFAVLFLLFMAPLPIPWYQPFALAMQTVASHLSTLLLQRLGVPVYQQGTYLLLPGYTLEIGAACSGLRQLVAIVALAVVMGELSGHGRWLRWTLGLLAVPIAIAANGLRVVISGLILLTAGPAWASGVFHTLEGLMIVALSALLLATIAWGLTRAWRLTRFKRPARYQENRPLQNDPTSKEEQAPTVELLQQ